KVHITKATLQQLDGQFEAEPGNGHQRDQYLADHQVETFLIVPTKVRHRQLARLYNGRPIFLDSFTSKA
ncbi:hypothetical protein AVEN_119054-1, partial [Araneus ventricosus]